MDLLSLEIPGCQRTLPKGDRIVGQLCQFIPDSLVDTEPLRIRQRNREPYAIQIRQLRKGGKIIILFPYALRQSLVELCYGVIAFYIEPYIRVA